MNEEKWESLMLAFLQGTLCYYDEHPVYLIALHPYHGFVEVLPYNPGKSYAPGKSRIVEVSNIERIAVSQTK